MDPKLPAEADQEPSPTSTNVEVLQDGRIIIRAEIASNEQLAALKFLVDGLASQDLFPAGPNGS
jgi:hypothetical protein